jgi:hypothetical protein
MKKHDIILDFLDVIVILALFGLTSEYLTFAYSSSNSG